MSDVHVRLLQQPPFVKKPPGRPSLLPASCEKASRVNANNRLRGPAKQANNRTSNNRTRQSELQANRSWCQPKSPASPPALSGPLLLLRLAGPVPPNVLGRSWRSRSSPASLTNSWNSVLPPKRVMFVYGSQIFSSHPVHFTSNSAAPPRPCQFTIRSTSYTACQSVATCIGGGGS